MYLLQSWKESLAIFLPNNLMSFLLETLKSTAETFKIFFKYFWWLIILDLVTRSALNLGFFAGVRLSDTQIMALLPYILFLLNIVLVYYMCLIARPSATPKNYLYLVSHSYHFVLVIIVPLLCFLVAILWSNDVASWYIRCYSAMYAQNSFIRSLVLTVIPSLFVVFFLLFWFDSGAAIKSLLQSFVRSIKMVIYNVPFFLVALLLFGAVWCWWYLIFIALAVRASLLVGGVLLVLQVFLYALQICFFTNFYVKRLHDQFTLYFPNKG